MAKNYGWQKDGNLYTIFLKGNPKSVGQIKKEGWYWYVVGEDGEYQTLQDAVYAMIGYGPKNERNRQVKYYRLVSDPSKYPLRAGMKLSIETV